MGNLDNTSASTPANEAAPPAPLPPNEVTASLTVKIGGVTRTSRKQLAAVSFPFLLSEGFDVLRAKTNQFTARELQAAAGGGERHVRDDPAVYIRPGAHSKQAELVQLTDKNFEARVARSYRNFLKRKPAADALSGGSSSSCSNFACEIVTFVRKDATARRHRVSSSAGHAGSTTSTSGYGHASPSSHAGADAKMLRPAIGYTDSYDDGYGEQLSGCKRERPASMDLPHEGDGYKTVRMVLNGSVVPVRVNVRDLLACFTVGPQTPATGELGVASGQDDALQGAGSSSSGVTGGPDAASAGSHDGMM